MPKIPSDSEVLTSNDVFKCIAILESGSNGTSNRVINNIAENLRYLATPIESLTPDPMNARTHSERNLLSIIESLDKFGQVKPIVVRKQTMTVVAGNGTLESARRLGWTHIAANIIDMTEAQAISYGLADNRTADLAGWDFRVVAKLERLIQDTGEGMIGWDNEELNVIRSQLDWIPSEQEGNIEESSDEESSDEDSNNENGSLTELDKIEFEFEDYVVVQEAIESLRRSEDPEMSDGVALAIICKQWLEMNG